MKFRFLLTFVLLFSAGHPALAILDGAKVAKNSLFSKRIAHIEMEDYVRPPLKSSAGMCTGAFIARDLVITAAHCLTQYPYNRIAISVGSFKTTAKRAIPNSMFRDPYLDVEYDIALIQTADLLPGDDIVTPVNFDLGNQTYFLAIGFGQTATAIAAPSHKLTYTEVEVDPALNVNSYLIGVRPMGAASLTYGDSGGPLLGLTQKGLTLFGVVRGNIGNTRECIFASTHENRDWILAVVKNLRHENASYWHSVPPSARSCGQRNNATSSIGLF